MRKTLLIGGKEVTLEALAVSSDGVCFTLNGKSYSFTRNEAAGKAYASPPNTKGERHVFAGALEAFIATPGASRRAGKQVEKGSLAAPMPGKIQKVLVKKGEKVKESQPLVIMEAMKMEITIRAAAAGVVEEICFKEGDQVTAEAPLVKIKE